MTPAYLGACPHRRRGHAPRHTRMHALQHERYAPPLTRGGMREGDAAARARARATIIASARNPHEQRLSGKRSEAAKGALRRTRHACIGGARSHRGLGCRTGYAAHDARSFIRDNDAHDGRLHRCLRARATVMRQRNDLHQRNNSTSFEALRSGKGFKMNARGDVRRQRSASASAPHQHPSCNGEVHAVRPSADAARVA